MKKFRTFVGILIALLMFAIAGVVYFILLGQWHTPAYAAGNSNEVTVYRIADTAEEDAEPVPEEAGSIVRGSEVTRYMESVTADGVTYCKVKTEAYPDEDDLYMPEDSLADDITEIIQQQAIASEQILIAIKQISAGVENFAVATDNISSKPATGSASAGGTLRTRFL